MEKISVYAKNLIDYLSEIFRKINIAILFVIVIAIFGINYGLSKVLANQTLIISEKAQKINSLRLEIDNDTQTIKSLEPLKTNVIYLTDKITAINTVKTILQQHNIDYTLNVNVPENASTGKYFQGLNNNSNSFLETNKIVSKDTKMSVFHYIPVQITIKNYVNYDNLTSAINELINNNLIINQISSKSKYAKPQELILGGRLYVYGQLTPAKP